MNKGEGAMTSDGEKTPTTPSVQERFISFENLVESEPCYYHLQIEARRDGGTFGATPAHALPDQRVLAWLWRNERRGLFELLLYCSTELARCRQQEASLVGDRLDLDEPVKGVMETETEAQADLSEYIDNLEMEMLPALRDLLNENVSLEDAQTWARERWSRVMDDVGPSTAPVAE